MSFADSILDCAVTEHLISKDPKYSSEVEMLRLNIDSIFNQLIRMHCYTKGLEHALSAITKDKL